MTDRLETLPLRQDQGPTGSVRPRPCRDRHGRRQIPGADYAHGPPFLFAVKHAEIIRSGPAGSTVSRGQMR